MNHLVQIKYCKHVKPLLSLFKQLQKHPSLPSADKAPPIGLHGGAPTEIGGTLD